MVVNRPAALGLSLIKLFTKVFGFDCLPLRPLRSVSRSAALRCSNVPMVRSGGRYVYKVDYPDQPQFKYMVSFAEIVLSLTIFLVPPLDRWIFDEEKKAV